MKLLTEGEVEPRSTGFYSGDFSLDLAPLQSGLKECFRESVRWRWRVCSAPASCRGHWAEGAPAPLPPALLYGLLSTHARAQEAVPGSLCGFYLCHMLSCSGHFLP